MIVLIRKNNCCKKMAITLLSVIMTASFYVSAAVVTSVKPLGFISSAITDGVVQTEVLLPDGASPHDYALRPSDVSRLRNAQLVVWIGPEMEAFMTKSMQQIDPSKQIVLSNLAAIKKGLVRGEDDDDHDHHDDHGHHHGEYNMHIWMSPLFAKQIAITIHDKLITLFPEKRAKLDENLENFEQNLTKTEKQIKTSLQGVKNKHYFVFHDAYTYFENYFGLAPLGYFTVNPEIQPGAQRLYEIKQQLEANKATCIFAEPQFKPSVIHAIAQGTQVRIGTLDPLGMNVSLGIDSYMQFLTQLSQQYLRCLE